MSCSSYQKRIDTSEHTTQLSFFASGARSTGQLTGSEALQPGGWRQQIPRPWGMVMMFRGRRCCFRIIIIRRRWCCRELRVRRFNRRQEVRHHLFKLFQSDTILVNSRSGFTLAHGDTDLSWSRTRLSTIYKNIIYVDDDESDEDNFKILEFCGPTEMGIYRSARRRKKFFLPPLFPRATI